MTNRHIRAASEIARVGLFVGVIAAPATPAVGQVLYGGMTGTVTDSTGANLPGASVTITHKETNFSREAVSSEAGIYTFTNVQAGAYDVRVSLTGFREFIKTDVPVRVNQISRVDVRLEIGAIAETVTVRSAPELLQTDKADVHTELKSTEITSLPLNQFRNYQALLNLVPGATPGVFQNAETDTPARSLSTNINGQNRNNNGTRTDGATNLNVWLPHHNVYVSPAETIDTVNISTDNFDAEQGMAGGAAITVITKSGTNQFRGSTFEFYNGDKLNATPYFFGTGAVPDKPPMRRNIFGGTIGGPIQRNRLFFFGSFEGYRQDLRRNNFFNVPNAALRAGDFSNARNANGSLQIIYDPQTGNPDGSGRTPFPGNIIPRDRLNPIALKLLSFYPLPNSGGTGAGNLTNNYFREERRTTDRDNYDIKINFNRTSAHQIWGKFSMLDDECWGLRRIFVNSSNDRHTTRTTQLQRVCTPPAERVHGSDDSATGINRGCLTAECVDRLFADDGAARVAAPRSAAGRSYRWRTPRGTRRSDPGNLRRTGCPRRAGLRSGGAPPGSHPRS